MESAAPNYWLFWLVYLLAASVFYTVFWRATRYFGTGWFTYMLRAVTVAVILTPWYINPQDNILAPALMVVMLDGITIGGEAAIRAIVPLFLSISLSLIVALALLIINKIRRKKLVKASNNK